MARSMTFSSWGFWHNAPKRGILFGYQFAPRYKDIFGKVTASLYGFKHPRQYKSGLLKPVRKISKKLIIEEVK